MGLFDFLRRSRKDESFTPAPVAAGEDGDNGDGDGGDGGSSGGGDGGGGDGGGGNGGGGGAS